MKIIDVRNVHEALPEGLRLLIETGLPMASRAGDVIVAPMPVTTIYQRPTERVILWPERDANPFFHFFESLYYLAGRRDLAWIQQILPRMKDFSDDGHTLQGSYGYRWRTHFGFDQLECVLELLKKEPFSRRAVVSMWDPRYDLLDNEAASKDVPCNTTIKFRTVFGKAGEPNRLNMIVFNRSNDIIWGLYGANAVHFSMLQEYVASKLSLLVGTMTTVSTDFHAYTEVYKKVYQNELVQARGPNPYATGFARPFPIMDDPENWDRDLYLFMEKPLTRGFGNRFFSEVAQPLWKAHTAYKSKDWPTAFEALDSCAAWDWRRAAKEWLERRQEKQS